MPGFGEIAERLRRSTVHVIAGGSSRGTGSGVIWSPDGMIVTNAHVACGSGHSVELWDGRRFEGRIESRDVRRDLAVLRVPAAALPAAIPGDTSVLRPGELVIAVGNPMGFSGALSTGVIHSIGPLPGMARMAWIRASVRLAPGNSGGPLANAQGQVIGINTAVVNGIGVAVPASAVEDFLRRGARPSLGVTLRPVVYGRNAAGLLILEVEPGGAAARASLWPGDILVGVNGATIASIDDLGAALDAGPEVLRLDFLRGDRSRVREAVVRPRTRAEAA